MSVHLVLDIDNVLTDYERPGDLERVAFFKNKGAIIEAIKTHYIFPGVIEFIQRLFQIPEVKISFFSSGDKQRNILFAEELLKLVFSAPKYAEIREQVCIIPNDRLTAFTEKETFIPLYPASEEKPNCENMKHKVRVLSHDDLVKFAPEREGERKSKDLTKVVKQGAPLENVILIDDQPSYTARGQEKNFLQARYWGEEDFRDLAGKQRYYQENGLRFLKCEFSSRRDQYQEHRGRRLVGAGTSIVIMETFRGYELNFLSQEGEYQRIPLSLEQHGPLIEKILTAYENRASWDSVIITIYDQTVIKEIAGLVLAQGGIATKICRRANKIYYTAGLLFAALEESAAKKTSVSEALFNLQNQKKEDGTYEHMFTTLRKRDSIYELGLQKLREVNSELQFITPQSYVAGSRLPDSEEERMELEKIRKNSGGNECSIM